ncbi:hypothetical protein COCVIDRAFT_87865, partial [Bipolaris victoriae FI3]
PHTHTPTSYFGLHNHNTMCKNDGSSCRVCSARVKVTQTSLLAILEVNNGSVSNRSPSIVFVISHHL